MTGKEALDNLMEGNQRFVSGERCGVSRAVRPDTMVDSPHPFAAVPGCADPRVPPEHIFDRSPGEMFVIRMAGNHAGTSELGSLEYAVAHLHAPLILELGHGNCGAVKAALSGTAPGAVDEIPEDIRPALDPADAGKTDPETVSRSVEASVRNTKSNLLTRSDAAAETVSGERVLLVGAVYSLRNGTVAIH